MKSASSTLPGNRYRLEKKLPKVDNANYSLILRGLSKPKLKTYVIDDSQYLMAFESFENVDVTGYTKFTTMALNFYNLINFVITKMPNDVIVYFLHHTEIDETGRTKAKTLGKMLDNQLTVEGLFSIVLLAKADGGEYTFTTNSDGTTPAKSPMEMFEMKIDNDLKMVDNTIREYYNI